MVLTISSRGDMSVGINPTSYDIDCPFNLEETEQEEIEWFRSKMFEIFKEFDDMVSEAEYDFEIQAQIEVEKYLEEQLDEIEANCRGLNSKP